MVQAKSKPEVAQDSKCGIPSGIKSCVHKCKKDGVPVYIYPNGKCAQRNIC